jgi:hypothetical protein
MRNIIKKVLKEEFDSKSERIKSIVNKYGVDQAIDMIVDGKNIIRQVYNNDPYNFLEQFNNLIPVESYGVIFYKDKNKLPLFYYYPNQKNSNVFINKEKIWMFFSDVIGLKTHEIQEIISNWLEETYNITGFTPRWKEIILKHFVK